MLVQSMPYPAAAPVAVDTPFNASGATAPFIGAGTHPSAFYDSTGDRTWVAWEGWDGERVVYVQTYDHALNRWEKRYEVSRDGLTDDDHGVPAICMDHEGYVHCFWGSHSSHQRHATTVAARDPTAWRGQAELGPRLSYPHPVLVGSTLYLFARVWDGTTEAYWTRYKTSSLSGGTVTWGSAQNVAQFTGGRFYQGGCLVVGTSIHFIAVYSNNADTQRQNLYHFVYDTTDDSIDNSDASVSTAVGSQPISKTTADTSYRVAGPTTTDVGGFCRTPNGTLHIAYFDDTIAPYDIKYTNNSGSGWAAASVITSASGSVSNGYIDAIALIPRADNSVELYYPDDAGSAFTQGGDMKKMVRSSGGSWGSVSTALTAGAKGLGRPVLVQNKDEDLYLFFTEVAADANDSSAGGLKLYGYGSGGLVPPPLPYFTASPSISSSGGSFYGTGDVLTVSSTHSGDSETFQWKRNGSNIVGATSRTYTLTGSDEATTITVTVTATNPAGSSNQTSSGVAATAVAYATQTRTLSDASNRTLSDTTDRTISNRTA